MVVVGACGCWKLENELGVLAGLAEHFNPTSVVGDDAVADGKTEPHTLSHVLGGEEGVKDLVPDFLRNAGAVVLDGEMTLSLRVKAESLMQGVSPSGYFLVAMASRAF